MTFDDDPPFVRAMFDDDAWDEHVTEVGLVGARTELTGLKAELRLQRRKRPGDSEFYAKQAGFEHVAARRLAALDAKLAAQPDSGAKYRKRITELTALIGDLAREIDETDLEHLLDEYKIPLGGDLLTLGDALDDGRFDPPAPKAVAS